MSDVFLMCKAIEGQI